MSSKSKKKARIPGLVISIVLLLVTLEFIGVLAVTKLLPSYLLVAASGVVLLIVALVAVLTSNFRKKAMFSVGAVLGVLLLIVLIIGNLFLLSTYNTLTRISGVNTKTSEIGVYVRVDDSAQTIQDVKDYTFGTLATLDVDNTAEAVKQINEAVNGDIKIKKEISIMTLVDNLLKKDTDVIILNYAYLPIIKELEGYEDIEDKIREIESLDINTIINDSSKKDSGTTKRRKTQDGDVIHLYISGIDTRGSAIVNTRSDVNIIATINMATKQVLLVSTPRDYFVPLSISGGIPDKLTHAGIYGIDVSMDTLGMLYDVEVDDYFRVNFAGFIKIIDALGGVDVYSDVAFTSEQTTAFSYQAGMNHVNGEQALAFARERYAFQEGDRQRGKNQMEVIRAVIQKVLSSDLLSNYADVLSGIEGCFETSFSYDRIAELVREQLTTGGSWDVISYSVDGTGDTRQPYSMSANAYVMIPDESTVLRAKALMKAVEDGKIISDADKETISTEEVSTTTSDTFVNVNEDAGYVDEGNAYVNEGNNYVDEGNTYVDEGNTYVDGGNTYVDEDNTYVDEDNTYVGEDNTYVDEDNTYVDEDNSHVEVNEGSEHVDVNEDHSYSGEEALDYE